MKTVLGIALLLVTVILAPAQAADSSAPVPVAVTEAWARASGPNTPTGIAFVTLSNGAAVTDRLVAASTPVAAKVEFHSHVAADGMMKMRQQAWVELPAGGKVRFSPSGLHLMLVDLKAPLVNGRTFPLTLTFEKSAPVTVTIAVGAPGAPGPEMSVHDHAMHDEHMNDPAHKAMHDEHMKDPDHKAMHEMMHGPGK
ncbi:MAG: copper chaperone PCu(A)C [Magnetospirillum sp.]|nr:copper chaperone PCu(A)C [Magnetospirillum sp.]